jgi:hypothetical protein
VCACALVSQNEICGKSANENFARTLAKNNFKKCPLKTCLICSVRRVVFGKGNPVNDKSLKLT